LYGHRWREIATKITDAYNNKVNNSVPAPHALNFSLSIHLINLCGGIVGVFDDAPATAPGRTAFYSLYTPQNINLPTLPERA
jgi:hypothetical protein